MRTQPVLYGQRSVVRNAQRQLILESADAIAREHRDRVSAQVFNTLAYERASDGRHEAAEQYFRAAIKAASDSSSAVLVSLQGLATLYMTPGTPITNLPMGRQSFRQAMDILRRGSDEASHYQRAQSYMQFAWMEATNGQRIEGARLIRSARDEIAALSPRNPARGQLSATINEYFDDNGFMKAQEPSNGK
jgi:hypothetical protein